MTIHQTYGPGSALAALCLDDIDTSGREPRVYDFTLARALGYQHARNIRRLIKTSRAELDTHGELVCRKDRTGGTGNLLPDGANARAGRPGDAFYLNEAQALVICALTRTSTAAHVRGELIRVFLLYRHRRVRHLARAERNALRTIIERADVVMAPDAYDRDIFDDPLGEDEEGRIPYLLAPITHGILETLAEFEADAADLEDVGDYEPDVDTELNGDEEDVDGDERDDDDEREPWLGAHEIGEHESQDGVGGWTAGQGTEDRELAAEAGYPRRRAQADLDREVDAVGETAAWLNKRLMGLLDGSIAGNIRPVSPVCNVRPLY